DLHSPTIPSRELSPELRVPRQNVDTMRPIVRYSGPARAEPRFSYNHCDPVFHSTGAVAGSTWYFTPSQQDPAAMNMVRPPRYWTEAGSTTVEAAITISLLL